MKRTHVVVGVVAALVALGIVGVRRHEATPETASTPELARGTVRVDSTPHTSAAEPVTLAPRGPAREPKALTDGQRALAESQIPAVAALSVDRAGSPREWLASTRGPVGAARDAELSALSPRSRAHLDDLREKRAQTMDPAERARLDTDIRTFERNIAERRAIMSRTVTDSRRPFAERAP